MKKWIGSFFVFAVLLTVTLSAKIVETNSICDILKWVDEDTLVVTDLNNTLIETTELLGSDYWVVWEINKRMEGTGHSKEKVLEDLVPLWHRILLASKFKLVEPCAAAVIYQLQKQGNVVIGLTAQYPEMAYNIIDQLQFVGINLSETALTKKEPEILGGYAAKHIGGVIFNGLNNDKGETLFRFLAQQGYTPKKVLFIDDKLKHVKSVGKAVEGRNIPYIGVRYSFTDHYRDSFDPAIVNKQLEVFQKNLRDDEAIKLIGVK